MTTLRGTVDSGKWIVEAITSPAAQGGFTCQISITQSAPEPEFGHAFAHYRAFETEEAAVLDGLRAGMTWIELKNGHVFGV
ncbi:hypothetical protein [Paraburkholderia acidipaludis]|uniref:hypothetical protein n=1 Tax=Paraburkholderia acidipaludis TaxID=660537 RepID=UPI0005B8B48F|nr:hypothetical protein [Paraburkholderia acidipaludis]